MPGAAHHSDYERNIPSLSGGICKPRRVRLAVDPAVGRPSRDWAESLRKLTASLARYWDALIDYRNRAPALWLSSCTI